MRNASHSPGPLQARISAQLQRSWTAKRQVSEFWERARRRGPTQEGRTRQTSRGLRARPLRLGEAVGGSCTVANPAMVVTPVILIMGVNTTRPGLDKAAGHGRL